MDNTITNKLSSILKEICQDFTHVSINEQEAVSFIDRWQTQWILLNQEKELRDEIKKNDDEIENRLIDWRHYEYTVDVRFGEPAKQLNEQINRYLYKELHLGHQTNPVELLVIEIQTTVQRLLKAKEQEFERVNASPIYIQAPVIIAEDKRQLVYGLLSRLIPANEEGNRPELHELIFFQRGPQQKIPYKKGAANVIAFIFWQLHTRSWLSGNISTLKGIAKWISDTFDNCKEGTILDALQNKSSSSLAQNKREPYIIK